MREGLPLPKYREVDYKYVLEEDYFYPCNMPWNYDREPEGPQADKLQCGSDGLLIKAGYGWNGASLAIDTKDKTASLVHDAIYDAILHGLLDPKFRYLGDAILRRINRIRGMSWFRRWYWWLGVRIAGGLHV